MRARYPDIEARVERNGTSIHYEVYDNDGPTILLLPTWHIIHSRQWKMQIPYLARHYRVVAYDPVGNGKSDRSDDPERFSVMEGIEDAVAVLDASGTETCLAIGYSYSGGLATVLAALHPERVDGVIAIAPSHFWSVPLPGRENAFENVMNEVENPQGWEKYNLSHWRNDWEDFIHFFHAQVASDKHSTKLFDDAIGWSRQTTGDQIATQSSAPPVADLVSMEEQVRAIDMPFMIVQGTDDQIINPVSSEVLAGMIDGAQVVWIEGAGHGPHARYPVKFNNLVREFTDRTYGIHRSDATWHAGVSKPNKVLYVSSPIGLGHARRDLAIAQETKKIHPDVEIEWLAQDPVTRVLEAAGETIHPASEFLASESTHIEAESGEHDLHAFQAIRNMDEILNANFMVFDEVVKSGQHDLVIADEAWDLDYHLHENPEIKKAPLVWMTDFVGWVPMPSGGDREAFVAADYNAEMITQVGRYGRVRDQAIFVGTPDDIIDRTFGPGLPHIREWTEDNFDFSGYITGFDPADLGPRDELRSELGFGPDETVAIVSVGGSGVGRPLLEKISKSYSEMNEAISGLRMIIVTGPRIDPDSLPQIEGVEYHAYVDGLYRQLAASDLAIVQGGLTTTMELTAARVPFIYVPLRNHFEQNFHVRNRLDRYRAGHYMDYDEIEPEQLAEAATKAIANGADYEPVETDGAARAASLISKLI